MDKFELSENASWGDYYTSLEKRLKIFKGKYRDNQEAMEISKKFQAKQDFPY